MPKGMSQRQVMDLYVRPDSEGNIEIDQTPGDQSRGTWGIGWGVKESGMVSINGASKMRKMVGLYESIWENPIQVDDLGVPPFQENSIF